MPRVNLAARESTYTVDEAAAVEIDADAQESLAVSVGAENEDFTFTEALEAEAGALGAMDNEDGVTANWDSTITKRVRVLATVVVDEGTGLAAEGDTVDVQVWKNEAVALVSDEGQTDVTEAAGTFNIDKSLPVAGGDILRLVIEAGSANEAGSDYDIAAAGEFDLIPQG